MKGSRDKKRYVALYGDHLKACRWMTCLYSNVIDARTGLIAVKTNNVIGEKLPNADSINDAG